MTSWSHGTNKGSLVCKLNLLVSKTSVLWEFELWALSMEVLFHVTSNITEDLLSFPPFCIDVLQRLVRHAVWRWKFHFRGNRILDIFFAQGLNWGSVVRIHHLRELWCGYSHFRSLKHDVRSRIECHDLQHCGDEALHFEFPSGWNLYQPYSSL